MFQKIRGLFKVLAQRDFELEDKYILEGALTEKYYTDAQHIGISTILKVEFRYGMAIIDANLYDSKLMLIIP